MVEYIPKGKPLEWNPEISQTEGTSIELSPLSDMNKILNKIQNQMDDTKILEKIILSVELHQNLIHAVNNDNVSADNKTVAITSIVGIPIIIDENLEGKKWVPVYKENTTYYPYGLKVESNGKVTAHKKPNWFIVLWRRIKVWLN